MDLRHSYTIPVAADQAWNMLLDVAQVAPCFPGFEVRSVDGDLVHGTLRIKIIFIQLIYIGTVQIIERDKAFGVIAVRVSGEETNGAGSLSATIRLELKDYGDQTLIRVRTALRVTGKPEQFGTAAVNEVAGKLVSRFATNLTEMISAGHIGMAPPPTS